VQRLIPVGPMPGQAYSTYAKVMTGAAKALKNTPFVK
jgi:hypothetical protein